MDGLRRVMSRFATGVTVVTTGGSTPHGMTANAFTSVSLDPPLVLCCVSLTARLHAAVVGTGSFGVSLLAADQEDAARHFADGSRPEGRAQFDGYDWRPGPRTGAPLLSGALGWLECEVEHRYPGGDHAILLGRVLTALRGSRTEALLFADGALRAAPPPPPPPPGVRERAGGALGGRPR
ncbi:MULTISPECIES: flavin reductase family protein [unclassified Nocardiopsis]|uniref:flavin reductase family protein n=1 Tax=unclassified Nocardiopsis TaxID=2649073 RepID=UPI0013572E04|nr:MULTISPECIES: flavin reductase family protein [unclassified Nocardiopsis]